MQLANWLAAPLQLPGIYLFVRVGERLTRSPPVHFSIAGLVQQFHAAPLQFLQQFGMTGLRGVLGWLLIAPAVAAAVYVTLAAAAAPAGAAARRGSDRIVAIEFWRLWLAALLFAIVLMTLIWRLARRIGNAGIVDIAWSAGFAPVVLFYAAAGSGAHRGAP